eukprot:2898609-Pleurochrysis_carterae.AAC.3
MHTMHMDCAAVLFVPLPLLHTSDTYLGYVGRIPRRRRARAERHGRRPRNRRRPPRSDLSNRPRIPVVLKERGILWRDQRDRPFSMNVFAHPDGQGSWLAQAACELHPETERAATFAVSEGMDRSNSEACGRRYEAEVIDGLRERVPSNPHCRSERGAGCGSMNRDRQGAPAI